MVEFDLPGTRAYQERLFPDPALLDPAIKAALKLDTYADVIAHFVASSLDQDGIQIQANSLSVTPGSDGYAVRFDPLPASAESATQFATVFRRILDDDHGGLALKGFDACKATPAFNPMGPYPVNKHDGPSTWLPFIPLGMPIVNHRGVMLLHYPPMVAYKNADYLSNNTLNRWAMLLDQVGIDNPKVYHAIVDVNPIAAPGSGESEYPNDYFPINLTSMFFDNPEGGLTYLRAMLELMLDPPANADNPCTLPLLVGGSDLYDPQAPGWFRTAYKDQLPQDENGVPQAAILQAGYVRIRPDSQKLTPYMIANHMIAAGVTGVCNDDPAKTPNIQQYEAQDLTAAMFLKLIADGTAKGLTIAPGDAKAEACQRWFGAPDGGVAPNPPAAEDKLILCAMAQVDLNFNGKAVAPWFTFDQAKARCQQYGGPDFSPCQCQKAAPDPNHPS